MSEQCKQIRRRLNVTRSELAAKIGTTGGVIYEVEELGKRPSRHVLFRLSELWEATRILAPALAICCTGCAAEVLDNPISFDSILGFAICAAVVGGAILGIGFLFGKDSQ